MACSQLSLAELWCGVVCCLSSLQEELGLPLVSMSPRDVVLGRRKIILSLVYQLMRYHAMQLLESIAAPAAQQQRPPQQQQHLSSSAMLAAGLAAGGTPATTAAAEVTGGSPSVTPRSLANGRVKIFSNSKKQRRQLAITEQDILRWANSKLQQVQPLHSGNAGAVGSSPAGITAAAADGADSIRSSSSSSSTLGSALEHKQGQQQADDGEPPEVAHPVITSFRDPVLKSGLVLLQLLHVMDPCAVDLAFVTPGVTPEQRQSNAKYALSVADKMGCSLFLVWEDLVDLQPRMVLVLLASLMYLDQARQRQQQQVQVQEQ